MSDNVTLEFLAQQQTRILAELTDSRRDRDAMKRDMDVLIRAVLRLDHTMTAMREDMATLWLNDRDLRERVERLEKGRDPAA